MTPSHQYPLGMVMSASRRLQLLDWARRSGSWIIEDDYDSEYRYESLPIASLQGLDRDARVIYVGTFSKVLFPALRLGYVVLPADLVARFAAVRDATDIFPPTFAQAVLADFIREGHFARHLRRMRALYQERRGALVDALRTELGDVVTVLGDEAGMHLVASLKGIRRRLRRRGSSGAPGALGDAAFALLHRTRVAPGFRPRFRRHERAGNSRRRSPAPRRARAVTEPGLNAPRRRTRAARRGSRGSSSGRIPRRTRTPDIPGAVVRNEIVPSGFLRDATSLFHSPKSKIVAPPARLTAISPSAGFE